MMHRFVPPFPRESTPRAAAFAAALLLFLGLPLAAQEPPAAGSAAVVIDTIEVVGNARVPSSSVLALLTFRAGDTIIFTDVQEAIGRLWATQQFSDVQLHAVPDPSDPTGAITLRITVEEQPLVAAIEFNGLENISASAVRDTAGLQAGLPLDPAAIAEAEGMVRLMLADKGFRVRSIEHRLEDIPDQPDAKRLVFDVAEGQRVALADVQFEGNEAFTDATLASVMDTKEEGFLWFRGGTFDEEGFRQDVRDRLPSFYARNGYIDFGVLGDSMVVDPESGKARLIVTVSEGPQYVLEDFQIRGNRRFATEDLRRYFEQRRGGLLRGLGLNIGGSEAPVEGQSIFDAVAFDQATTEVNQLYRNNGYLYARVLPDVERIPAREGARPTVRATWDISEQTPAFINEVRIEGNTFTHEDVIRGQLLVLPGDVYSDERLIQSYQRISALGFFETPMPFPTIEQVDGGTDVDITFEVEEKQTGTVNFGTALGGALGISGFLGYDQPNLFGQAKSGHLRWEFGRYSNNLEASYSDPAIMGSRYSGSLSLFSSRDRFYNFSEGFRRRTGASTRFGIPFLGDQYTRLSIGYSLSRTSYHQFDEEQQSSLFELPTGIQSTMTLALARSTVDHPTFPTVGTRQQFEASFSGGPLGGDGDFQKYTMEGAWYVPVGSLGGNAPNSSPVRFTLGLTAEAGAIFGDPSRFPFERFWMGGVQFGRPLRGYDETTVTPLGYLPECDRTTVSCPQLTDRFGDAYVRLSAEYAMRLSDNISLGLFYDAGNVWREPGEINPTRLLRGAGVGVTLVTPFGPLGLDYAYGFDKAPPGWQLHFKFGQGF